MEVITTGSYKIDKINPVIIIDILLLLLFNLTVTRYMPTFIWLISLTNLN